MSELGRQIFLKSRDQYESAIRWAFLLVVFGIAVHATVFSRAVELQKELQTRREAFESLSSLQDAVGRVSEKTAAFNASMARQNAQLDTLTTAWLEDLKTQFRELDALLLPDFRGVDRGVVPSPVQQRAQEESRNADVQRELLRRLEEAGLPEKLVQAESLAVRREMIAGFINEQLIPSSFERLNAGWKVPDALLETAVDLKQAIRAIGTAPDSAALAQAVRPEQLHRLRNNTERLAALTPKVDEAVAAVKSVSFRPPEGTRWWGTVEGKASERVAMAENAKAKVSALSSAEATIAEVTEELEQAVRQQEQATQDLNERLEKLQEQLEAGAADVAGLGTGWLPIGGDMDVFVRRFPLLLGLLLSIVIIWPTYRRLTLARAIALYESEEKDENVQRFLKREYGGALSGLNGANLALAIGGFVWIGLAIASAADSPRVGTAEAAVAGLGGGIAFAAALVYRAYAIKQVRSRGASSD